MVLGTDVLVVLGKDMLEVLGAEVPVISAATLPEVVQRIGECRWAVGYRRCY